ncbi:MAG: AGE family epimerase/isomerase [Polaromonas sp.]|nr:AGE family epimerase/isomerase [Polaromonas sp.]
MPADSSPLHAHIPGQAAAQARHWLFELALPLWWSHGADHQHGGFHEKLDAQGQPVGQPTRVRVQARQVFVYARAGALGWSGPWQAAMRHGLDFMLARHQRTDGFFRSTLDEADTHIDLYDQAFVLFALAHAFRAGERPDELLAIARKLMAQLDTHLGLEDGGYRPGLSADRPATAASAASLQANPLMHLLEAQLAWVSAGVSQPFAAQAETLCRLALDQLIDPDTGAIGETFSAGWAPRGPLYTRVYEPGHQFEWAWLLIEAQNLLGRDVIDAEQAALRLDNFGRTHGIDPVRGVAVFAVDGTGKTLDARARIWAQTEWLRTSLLCTGTRGNDSSACAAGAARSFDTLQRFLQVPRAGLWHEWMLEDGQFEAAPSPASSLYHLMTGLEGLLTAAQPASARGIERTTTT